MDCDFSCDFTGNGFQVTSSYVLGLSGEQLSEYSVAGGASAPVSAWLRSNVFLPGGLAVTYHDTDTYFALNDWLGTRRGEVSAGGCLSTWTGLAFGNGINQQGVCTGATEFHFTGKERDPESALATNSGNDYFGARYYSSTLGRWLSPDWSAKAEPVPYAKLDNPQSLNLYSYVLNNPLTGVDADGHAGSCGGAANDGSSCLVTNTQISQNISFYNNQGSVTSTVNVTTNMTTISNSSTGAVVSANASATATNVSGAAFSSAQLSTIGSTIGAVQQAGASMALGANSSQLMTAITAKESTLGLMAPANPLQLSGSSGYQPHPGDTAYNIQGALNVLQERGKGSGYDPATTYNRYNGVSDPIQRATNVSNFMNIYNGMTQSSWSWSPSMPAAPIPAGLQ